MNKKELNNEIILCRPAVRKARVAVIRKILKKMKILKSCKIESMKEKKLKKAERLFKKLQIMKKAKDDEVTKFALRNGSLENYLKGAKANVRQRAFACLAMHDAIMKKIISIRERIPNWETEIPDLLDSLGKNKKSAKKLDVVKTNVKSVIKDEKKSKSDLSKDKTDSQVNVKGVKVKVSSPDTINNKATNRTFKVAKKMKEEDSGSEENHSSSVGRTSSIKINQVDKSSDDGSEDSSSLEQISENTKLEKVDDPFFIAKKVNPPKLVMGDASNKRSASTIGKFNRNNATSVFNTKPFKVKREPRFPLQKRESEPSEEKLHPSWAAKKVKLIKPFEGKKIKFTDD